MNSIIVSSELFALINTFGLLGVMNTTGSRGHITTHA